VYLLDSEGKREITIIRSVFEDKLMEDVANDVSVVQCSLLLDSLQSYQIWFYSHLSSREVSVRI
jgi:hypothetical protein